LQLENSAKDNKIKELCAELETRPHKKPCARLELLTEEDLDTSSSARWFAANRFLFNLEPSLLAASIEDIQVEPEQPAEAPPRRAILDAYIEALPTTFSDELRRSRYTILLAWYLCQVP
jgi:hypothetical protein